jgi:sn-glycerol 3-phosphate transport system substrate-binding protein
MFSFKHGVAVAVFAVASLAGGAARAEVEIQFWHSMTGAMAERVNGLADRFNQSQKTYKVMPVFKGSYADAMAAAIMAAHAGNAPDIVQVNDAGTASMLAAADQTGKRKKSLIKPVYELMTEGGRKFDAKIYLPAVTGYYTDRNGRMLSFPLNSSTAVFYYNKDAFKKAGMKPDLAPKTWQEVQAAAQNILDTHATACGYTTGWPSWIHVETLHAWDNEEFASKLNGFGGLDSDLVFNDRLEVRHIALLEAWSKGKLASFGRSTSDAEARFAAGECAMLTSSSTAYNEIRQKAKFELAVAPLPYYSDYPSAPQNTLIGGASLWVMAGKKPAEYKGVAEFFVFLSQPEIQAEWHQQTGYLPLTQAAYDLSKKQGFYERNPGADVALLELTANKPTPISRGIRLGDFAQIRGIIDEELADVWNGKKAPKEALDNAVRRGNEVLRKFEKANKG